MPTKAGQIKPESKAPITVFDKAPKTDTVRKKRTECVYSCLNRSASPDSTAGRMLIEDWFSRFPAEEQKSMCSRFRSGKDKDFNSAFQELFLHEHDDEEPRIWFLGNSDRTRLYLNPRPRIPYEGVLTQLCTL
jgi:hypothetical protein